MNVLITKSSRVLLVVSLVGVMFLDVASLSIVKSKSQEVTFLPREDVPFFSESVQVGLPVRLRIPEASVDASIETVGIDSDGVMEAPVGGKNVGWFQFGSRPGEMGSAVMDGHFGQWKNGEGSVFDDLSILGPGDRVFVDDDTGKTHTFVVRESREYDPSADAREVFDADDAKSHLNLITCEGAWDSISKSYSKRLVVFTDKE